MTLYDVYNYTLTLTRLVTSFEEVTRIRYNVRNKEVIKTII